MSQTIDYPHDADQEIIVEVDALRDLLVKLYVKQGMYKPEAQIGADRLIEADLRGIQSHGSRAVGRYLEAIDMGDIDPRAQVITETDTPAIAVLDGGKGLGHVAATRGMHLAIEKAKAVGTGTVAIKRGQHYGAAAIYAQMAVDAGMIGYTTTSTGGATVAPLGGKEPATANNAFAWGVPVREGAPFILDMACAVSSWGKVESLGIYGEQLPEGWALDEAGNATQDPKAAKTLMPAAGARGYGLAFLSSVLAGTLVSGMMPIHKTRSPAVEGSEHFFYAIDIAQFGDLDKFHERTSAAMNDIRGLTPAEGVDRVCLPGEIEWERENKWRVEGLPIHRDHAATLEKLATAAGLQVPWE